MGRWRSVLATLLVIAGILALALGLVYLVTPVHSVPSFLPGHVVHSGHPDSKYTHRAYAGIGVGAVLLIFSLALIVSGKRRRKSW